ncbi:hypothetical protein AGLY_004581 [Aphis glycines]|uniref:Transmembrane protein n=1 Tax=Aphis glycines TaxID=307491 RepID=A0A6G0TWL4_APHGL|nr:hypothetical protein AGLY_004581 [Aphis glycines]
MRLYKINCTIYNIIVKTGKLFVFSLSVLDLVYCIYTVKKCFTIFCQQQSKNIHLSIPTESTTYKQTVYSNYAFIFSATNYVSYFEQCNSERSDECIDFTMMCVFFFCVCRQHLEHPSLKRKLNLVGTLRGQKSKIFKPQKNEGKRDFLRKTSLRQNRIFYFAITQKLIDNLYKICQNSENLQFLISYSYSDKKIIRINRHNFFLLAFKVQILTKTRQNHEYLQIILLTNHLRSESFFVYNDTYHCIQI